MAESVEFGNFEIDKLELVKLDGSKRLSIKSYAQSLDIYEDVLYPTIYADLLLLDGVDLGAPRIIIGEEFIELELSSKKLNEPLKLKLQVVDIGNDNHVNDRGKVYKLGLVSEEYMVNQEGHFSRRYKDMNENIVKSILEENLRTKKQIFLEETRGITDILITLMHPLEAIDMLKQDSISKKFKSSLFVFFENQKGFNFTTIENLFETGKEFIGDKVFFLDETNEASVSHINDRNILAYKQNNSSAIDTKIAEGLFTSVVTYDPISGDIERIFFDDQEKFKHPDDKEIPMTTSILAAKHKKHRTGSRAFVVNDTSKPKTYFEDILKKKAFLQRILSNITDIYVYGDLALAAGDVITCNLPEQIGLTRVSKDNRLISGNYMIMSLRHMFTFDKNRKHMISARLIKGNFIEAP